MNFVKKYISTLLLILINIISTGKSSYAVDITMYNLHGYVYKGKTFIPGALVIAYDKESHYLQSTYTTHTGYYILNLPKSVDFLVASKEELYGMVELKDIGITKMQNISLTNKISSSLWQSIYTQIKESWFILGVFFGVGITSFLNWIQRNIKSKKFRKGILIFPENELRNLLCRLEKFPDIVKDLSAQKTEHKISEFNKETQEIKEKFIKLLSKHESILIEIDCKYLIMLNELIDNLNSLNNILNKDFTSVKEDIIDVFKNGNKEKELYNIIFALSLFLDNRAKYKKHKYPGLKLFSGPKPQV